MTTVQVKPNTKYILACHCPSNSSVKEMIAQCRYLEKRLKLEDISVTIIPVADDGQGFEIISDGVKDEVKSIKGVVKGKRQR